MRTAVVALFIAAPIIIACGSSSPGGKVQRLAGSAQPPVVSPTANVDKPFITADVVFVNFDPQFKLLRFVGVVRNESTQVAESVKIQWIAADSDGAIVGSFMAIMPPLVPHESFTYVGGAGPANLTGLVQSVKLTVTDSGRLSNTTPPGIRE